MRNAGSARLCAAAAATAAGLLVSAPMTSAASADPPVEVTVEDGGKALREGGTTSYTITLRNRTSHDYRGLTVAQMMPASFHPSQTQPKADMKPDRASWKTDLAAKSSQKFTLTGDVGTVAEQEAGHAGSASTDEKPRARGPAGEQPEGRGDRARVSTSVCVQEPVTVRDGSVSDGDTGAGDTQEPNGASTVGRILTCDSAANVLHASADDRGVDDTWLYASVGTVLLLAGGAGFALNRRRTRSSRA